MNLAIWKSIIFAFIETFHAMRLALINPVLSAICARTFSVLRYIKTYLKNRNGNSKTLTHLVNHVFEETSKCLQDHTEEMVAGFTKRKLSEASSCHRL